LSCSGGQSTVLFLLVFCCSSLCARFHTASLQLAKNWQSHRSCYHDCAISFGSHLFCNDTLCLHPLQGDRICGVSLYLAYLFVFVGLYMAKNEHGIFLDNI